MEKHQIRMKFLFQCLLFVYILTVLFFMHVLQDEGNIRMKQSGEFGMEKLRNMTGTMRNITGITFIYRNITKVVYVNKTIEKVVPRDKIVLPRYGPGENGTKVEIVSRNWEKLNKTDMEFKKKFHGFDTFLSDAVSLHRKLPDLRPPACLEIQYPKVMPLVSVVIIFRDEWHSILLRTAYSVLEMSPPYLLQEVVLVDDGSTDPELVDKVDLHVANVPKFKLVRNEVSLGLMMARQKGIDATIADYFIVLDGHMEVTPGWLEPVIHRLMEEPNALLCSHVGVVRGENFEYYIDDDSYSGIDSQFPFFDPLTLGQMWAWFSDEFRAKRNRSVAPIPYGTIQGMMTAMRKKFFYQLGGFDPGMKIWGSEQMELSVKVWLCGGRVEMIPCSKVAHMYRVTPWGGVEKAQYFDAANKARMIDVWMDPPYRGFIYDNINNINFTVGDLTDRHRIRSENQCKPYRFFVDTVRQFSNVYLPENPKRKGAVFNSLYRRCLDNAQVNDVYKIILYQCHGIGNQYFLLTEQDEIRTTGGHVIRAVANQNSTKLEVITYSSVVNRSDVKWAYREDGSIFHFESGQCLKAINVTDIAFANCSGELDQSWEWGYIVQN